TRRGDHIRRGPLHSNLQQIIWLRNVQPRRGRKRLSSCRCSGWRSLIGAAGITAKNRSLELDHALPVVRQPARDHLEAPGAVRSVDAVAIVAARIVPALRGL